MPIRREVTCFQNFFYFLVPTKIFLKKTLFLSLHPFPLFSQENCKMSEQEKDFEKRVFIRECLRRAHFSEDGVCASLGTSRRERGMVGCSLWFDDSSQREVVPSPEPSCSRERGSKQEYRRVSRDHAIVLPYPGCCGFPGSLSWRVC